MGGDSPFDKVTAHQRSGVCFCLIDSSHYFMALTFLHLLTVPPEFLLIVSAAFLHIFFSPNFSPFSFLFLSLLFHALLFF